MSCRGVVLELALGREIPPAFKTTPVNGTPAAIASPHHARRRYARYQDSLAKIDPLPLGLDSPCELRFPARNRLEREDFSRDARLLDASIAGVVLSFNPRDDEMREKAERSWETIRALLAEHLLAQTDSALPWDGDAVGSTTASDLLKKRYADIRSLARTVASVSFEAGSDGEIAEAERRYAGSPSSSTI